jgi:hypothetical protein
MIANLTSLSAAPVYSVLDQRRHSGAIYIDNDVFDAPGSETFDGTISSLWHGGVGYCFDSGSTVLSLSVGERTGAWSAIGTSTQPPETVDLFAAWIEHQDLTQPVSYAIFPGTTFGSFQGKSGSRDIVPLQNDAYISAILDADYNTVSAIFWDVSGGTIHLEGELFSFRPASVTVSGSVALMLDFDDGIFTVSDPSQTLTSVDVLVEGILETPLAFTVNLPSDPGGMAGSSVTVQFACYLFSTGTFTPCSSDIVNDIF